MQKLLRYVLLPFPAAYVLMRLIEVLSSLGNSAPDGIREPGEDIGGLVLVALVIVAQVTIGFVTVFISDRRRLGTALVSAVGLLVGAIVAGPVFWPIRPWDELLPFAVISSSLAIGFALIPITRGREQKNA